MKKLVLTTVCALAVTGAAFAQGTVNWFSIAPNAMTAQTNSTTYSPFFGGGSAAGGAVGATGFGTAGYYYELLNTSYSGAQATIPTLSSLLSWSDTGLQATNNASGTAGRLVPVNGNAAAAVPWANGVTNSIVLVGWSANLGTSWLTVSNDLQHWNTVQSTIVGEAFFGVSATGYLNPNLAPAAGATLFATAASANGLPINALNTQLYLLPGAAPVPEPATMALMGLGGLSLLLFRRQRKS
jgi:hypothetical protein